MSTVNPSPLHQDLTSGNVRKDLRREIDNLCETIKEKYRAKNTNEYTMCVNRLASEMKRLEKDLHQTFLVSYEDIRHPPTCKHPLEISEDDADHINADIQAALGNQSTTSKKRKIDAVAKGNIDVSSSSSSSSSSMLSIDEATSIKKQKQESKGISSTSSSSSSSSSVREEALERSFLLGNTTDRTQMPKSFYVPENYWKTIGSLPDNTENINERILATYGQNIYDAATWQIALTMLGELGIASQQTRRLLAGQSGDLQIRASSNDFTYGDQQLRFQDRGAFFFRMISDKWEQVDPLTGKAVAWMDWKPILGENAWAAFIGPLQVAYAKYKGQGQIPLNCTEVQLALGMLPALEAMQSAIGGVYHSTGGVHGKNPHDISTENNASLYAGLKMLKQVLQESKEKGGEKEKGIISRIDVMLEGIEKFFRDYAYDKKQGIFLQGGLYNDSSAPGQFIPAKDFAVDVQTWGITVLGAKKVDAWFGDGTSYRIWQETKKRSGYYESEVLMGVGYTDGPSEVLSVEWTCGAILLVKELNDLYHRDDLAQDAIAMRSGIEALKENVVIDGVETVAFHYANKRYWIPFGWWANKIPSLTSTAWVLMIDRNFNPFVLGGRTAQE